MPILYPEPGETLRDLIERVLPDLTPEVRADVQVLTGGERAALLVPERPSATSAAESAPSPAPKPATTSRRAQRRRSKEN
jgi:hypothetical protein